MNQQKYNQPIDLQAHQQARVSGVGIGNITGSIGHFLHDHGLDMLVTILAISLLVATCICLRSRYGGDAGELLSGAFNLIVAIGSKVLE